MTWLLQALPLTLLLAHAGQPLGPGRISKQAALDRVAQHACLTTLPKEFSPEALVRCVETFEHEIIVDDDDRCGRYGVLESQLPFCQAAVSHWLEAEREGDEAQGIAYLIRAFSRCSGAALCLSVAPKAAGFPRPSPPSAHTR